MSAKLTDIMVSRYTVVIFQVTSTLLLLLQSIANHPIPMNISDEEYLHPAKNNEDGFYSAPPCGEGQFRDPLEILGVKFPESKIKHLCKANVYMYANSISDVHFPPDAVKLCTSVCKCYQESMYIEPSVNVTLINSNCDYTGDTIIVEHSANETHAATCPNLSTACVCSYNVRCNRKTRLMKYTLTANERGYLKVMVADCGASACVT